jgi:type IX secretion system PorP/SprF family membrane protein
VTDRTDVYANFAYHLKLNEKMKLGLGLRGGGSYWTRDNAAIREVLSRHTQPGEWDPNDPQFAGDNKSSFLPNLGAGVFLYNKRFYAGLSIPEVLSYDPDRALSLSSSKVIPRQVRHYFATTGYAFQLNPDIVMKPSVLVKYTPDAPVELDANINFLFYNLLWLGGSYRTGDAFVGIVELQITKQLRVGYSYDFTFTDIQDYSSGSHEIMIGYDFGYDIMKMKTPRFF